MKTIRSDRKEGMNELIRNLGTSIRRKGESQYKLALSDIEPLLLAWMGFHGVPRDNVSSGGCD
jgi:hypothetical protein